MRISQIWTNLNLGSFSRIASIPIVFEMLNLFRKYLILNSNKIGSLKLYFCQYKLAYDAIVSWAKLMQNGFVGCSVSWDMINTCITNPERNVFGALIGIMLDYITFSCQILASAMSRLSIISIILVNFPDIDICNNNTRKLLK